MGEFKNVFRQLRLANHLTQSEMAEKLEISKSTISMYENGNREPDFQTLEKIADLFKVDTDYLLGRTDKTAVPSENAGNYYLNEDARNMAQFLYDNPEYKVLFDATRKVKKEDIEFVKQMIDRVRGDYDDTGC